MHKGADLNQNTALSRKSILISHLIYKKHKIICEPIFEKYGSKIDVNFHFNVDVKIRSGYIQIKWRHGLD